MESVLNIQIPSTHSRLDGVITTKDTINNQIIALLQQRPHTPTELAEHFHQTRESFSRNYLYPLRNDGIIVKVEGSNYYQLAKQKNNYKTIKKSLESESAIFQTELFKNWVRKNHAKKESAYQKRFATLCLGIKNKNFKIHPDNITRENWREIVRNMVIAMNEVRTYPLSQYGELNYSDRQTIRHGIKYGLGIEISEDEGIELEISGRKDDPKTARLHITPEQIEQGKKLLKKSNVELEWYLKFGVKTWSFVRPSTIYLIELEKMEFFDQVVEYVEGADGEKITDDKVIQYAKFRKDTVYSYTRRVCHFEVHENKNSKDYDKYILDPDFVEPLEKFYNKRVSQRKKYLFWDDNNTKFIFETYNEILKTTVHKDNNYFKKILSNIGFNQSDFGTYFRANYGFRHFGIQMWLIATDYNYDLVAEMSHEDTSTLKKWYGKRTKADFQRRIKSVMA